MGNKKCPKAEAWKTHRAVWGTCVNEYDDAWESWEVYMDAQCTCGECEKED